jgi:hypothetical protein
MKATNTKFQKKDIVFYPSHPDKFYIVMDVQVASSVTYILQDDDGNESFEYSGDKNLVLSKHFTK